jgi:hypothetical protein
MSASPFIELEHRWGQRFQVNIPVRVSIGLLRGIDGRLQNLSCSGGLLTADYRLRLHSLLQVHVHLPLSGHGVIDAHVTRAGKDEVGLEWCEFGSPAIKYLVQEARTTVSLFQSATAPNKIHLPFQPDSKGEFNAADT